MDSNLNVSGLADLQKQLDQLPALIERKLMRGAVRAGQKVVLDRAREGVHNVSGDLSRSLRISTYARAGRVLAVLKAGDKKAFYAHMVEFGTARHLIAPKLAKALGFGAAQLAGVKHPGAQPKPFMRPALDAEARDNSAALQAVAAYLQPRITKELANLPDERDETTQ